MPPEKTMVLACSFEGPWLERFFTKLGFSVIRCKSGAGAVSTISISEPDVFLIYGGMLEDMDGYQLMFKVREILPSSTMRFVFMHNADFDFDNGEDSIEWNFGPADVTLPKNTPHELLLPILEKMKEPYNEGNT